MKHFLVSLCLLFWGCHAEHSKEVSVTAKPKTYLDWAGTYIGVVPCADCEGIETILTLQRSGAYRLVTTYRGKNDQPFTQTGRFTWNRDSTVILLDKITEGPSQYRFGTNILLQLDLKGNQITGDLADKYKLVRTVESILGLPRWNLSELLGKYFERGATHIRFNPDNQQMNGYGWCNTFSCSYTLKDNQISFGELRTSDKICPDTTVERQLLNVFRSVDTYTLERGVLSLSRGGLVPMAKFEATAGR